MQIISDSDLLALYKTLGNDSAVINGGSAIIGIFSDKFLLITALGEEIESNIPNFTCRTSDLSGAANGQTLVVNTTTYYIDSLQDDSQGQTLVMLHL